ncbi:4-coumarate--CoA ligase-like 7 isoform X1 [Panicum miliaceum]|uniref:4-coumarate--CoA ligase n=1 Tax=Panicum miliaceum TaxID=4540 RepID=A0A3L6PG07_PANMI|nr:4-coumarate--CoA ligase-like 7 isoform X1 [Panicum miliaceum]
MATSAPAASADAFIAAPGGVDGRSGYCEATRTFRSLRPPVPLPPKDAPLSFPAFAFSLLPSPPPAHPALLDAATGEAVSFPAFRSQVRALAGALRSRLGLQRGDVAFVLAPARLDVPVLYFALLSFGAVASPANPALTAAEVAHLVALSGASVAFAVSSTAAKVPAGLPTVLLDSDQFRSFLRSEGRGEGLAPETVAVRQSETAAIQYSSGTTGRVKAAALSHRNFIAMAAGSHALAPKPRHGCDRMLLGAPMFHSLGFYFALKAVVLGQTTVLVTDAVARRGVKGVVEAAERWAVTEMTAAPPVVMAMAKEPCVLEALERVVCGGAPLPTTAAERFRLRFPNVDLCMGYGSTEAGGISLMIGREECSRIGSAGRVSENVEVKIVDHVTGKPLSVGQKGELLVRGPAVMTGYVGDDEANASTFDSEGWLKTGDLCYIDQDGFLFVVDRLKELIKYKGYQVPPAELELVLQTLPAVVDAAVMPYPHEEAGQIPIALVVRLPGSKITEAEVMDHVAKRVAPYKKIRKVLFVDSIPKSPAGKILRRQLTNYVQYSAVSRL